jgi:hypothetical protein
MPGALTSKENTSGDTPILLFDCTLASGATERWSSRTITFDGQVYDGRVLRHNLFESQVATEGGSSGTPRLSFELANADSRLSQVEQQTGFKGSRLTVRTIFLDGITGDPCSDAVTVFTGLMNPAELIGESSFRLSAINRMSMLRSVVPDVRIQRMCPWRFPSTEAQRTEAVDGGEARGKYSPFYRCGYSPDQPGGKGNMNGAEPHTSCSGSRGDCETRGMFLMDSAGRTTARFGGIEFVPATILVRGSGQKNSTLSAVQDNQARYNDFVPLVYGTQWHAPDVVFSRNDGNLTRMEVLIGMGPIEGILKVLVNGFEIPQGVSGTNMTSSGWFNIINSGTREGHQDPNFADGRGVPLGDPFGSMAYLSVVVPNRVSDGTSLPKVSVLVRGLKLEQFSVSGDSLGENWCDNPAWVLLDILRRGGYSLTELDLRSFALAAATAGELIPATDPVGGATFLPRFQCNFALKQRRSAGDVIRSLRNSSRIYLVLSPEGKLAARVEDTFANQQPEKPEGSNASNTFNGGWPAYEFGPSSIARNRDGSSSVRMSSRPAQDTPNRLSVEFQDSFNQYQQDSLSLSNGDDADLSGQEVAAVYDAAGLSSFAQASRMLLLALNRGIAGNVFIEFQTSAKALGLTPGDLITVTYPKENLTRAPFRIIRITPGDNFRTASILAQAHDDAWYSDDASTLSGGNGWHSTQSTGLPSSVCGVVPDAYGDLQLGIAETESAGSDGSVNVELEVRFGQPGTATSLLPSALIGLLPTVHGENGTLAGPASFFYAISAVDSSGGEGPLSFIAQADIASEFPVNSVELRQISLPVQAVAFHVYRGPGPQKLFRIANNVPPSSTFTDAGLPAQPILPPDPHFDHVNVQWRWEFVPETSAAVHASDVIGNTTLNMVDDRYKSAVVRITRGTGAGQERSVVANTAQTLSVSPAFTTPPDATSFFVVSESSWRFGARGEASPITISVPERLGAGIQITARAASVKGDEAAYALSPLTRWTVGQSGGLLADFDVPPAPAFGVSASSARGGGLDLGSIAFDDLTNTRGVIAGTYRFHHYDEVDGPAGVPLSEPLTLTGTTIELDPAPEVGSLLQLDREVIRVDEVSGTTVTVARAVHTTLPATHEAGTLLWTLEEKTVIVPFVKNFFGSPLSGDWKYTVELPNVRVASAELVLTNAVGNGPAAVKAFTTTNDSGLRTLSGGQYTFQIGGYLAIQTNAAPVIIVDADRAVRDFYAILQTPPLGAGVTLQLNVNGEPWTTLQFDPGGRSIEPVTGFGLPALRAGDLLSLDVTGVGTTVPGGDLTLVLRL